VAFLVIIGTFAVLLGLIVCTDRADNYWSNRRRNVVLPPGPPPPPSPPVFRYSLSQCRGCGMDDGPLNPVGRCFWCAELHALSGPLLPDPRRAPELR